MGCFINEAAAFFKIRFGYFHCQQINRSVSVGKLQRFSCNINIWQYWERRITLVIWTNQQILYLFYFIAHMLGEQYRAAPCQIISIWIVAKIEMDCFLCTVFIFSGALYLHHHHLLIYTAIQMNKGSTFFLLGFKLIWGAYKLEYFLVLGDAF